MDSTLVRLFGWAKAAGHKAIMRLFGLWTNASAPPVIQVLLAGQKVCHRKLSTPYHIDYQETAS